MSRPVKWRKVTHIPHETYFVPCHKKICKHNQVIEQDLKIEELEAMRLKDIEGFSQQECAEKMHISRQTFQNIIEEARKKVATALVKGQAINIGGGKYTKKVCQIKCLSCGYEAEMSYEETATQCSRCGSSESCCVKKNNCRECCKVIHV